MYNIIFVWIGHSVVIFFISLGDVWYRFGYELRILELWWRFDWLYQAFVAWLIPWLYVCFKTNMKKYILFKVKSQFKNLFGVICVCECVWARALAIHVCSRCEDYRRITVSVGWLITVRPYYACRGRSSMLLSGWIMVRV